MTNIQRAAALTIALTFFGLLSIAQAQTPSVSTVNLTPERGRVRIAPVGEVSDLRIEVVNEAGDTVFQGVQGAREQLDWNMKDSAGVRVPPGTYTVTVSYTTETGKQRKRIEQVLVTDERMTGGSVETKTAAPNAPNPQPLVDGGGAANRVPKFTDTDTLTSSVVTDVSGKVGVGLGAAAVSGPRLEVNGITKLTPGGSGGFMQFGTPASETGLTWLKQGALVAARADIRFNGASLTLAAVEGSPAAPVPPAANGVVISTSGRVSIGTLNQTSSYKMSVIGGSLVAVYGQGSIGVKGLTTASGGTGVTGVGLADGSYGISGSATGANSKAVYGIGNNGAYAGYFDGKVHVQGAFDYSSDRNLKTNFSSVDPRSILRKLSALPIQTWSYKNEGGGVRHLGPVAQDFRSAFGLGSDERSIGAVDANGVAFAAIQGLYQLVLEKDRKIDELQARVAQLEQSAKKRRQPRARK